MTSTHHQLDADPFPAPDAEALGALLAEQRRCDSEELAALVILRRELAELAESLNGYRAPLNHAILHEAHKPNASAWPLIEAMRAPSASIVDAAATLDLSVQHWIRGDHAVLDRAGRLFPDHSPLATGYVILSAGAACARCEFEVKLLTAASPVSLSAFTDDRTPSLFTCWPQGSILAQAHLRSLLSAEHAGLVMTGERHDAA